MNASISVKRNAPNWPAMVKFAKKTNVNEKEDVIPVVQPSERIDLPLTTAHTKADVQHDNRESLSKQGAAVARQCTKCQILYINFHSCI